MHSNERGNILFLILLAVVLFAALSYAVTQSLHGGGKNVSDEKAAAIAAQIINAIALQEPELMRFMERTKLGIHQIDFSGPYALSVGNSPNCASSTCDFWSASGGNVTPPVLPAAAANPEAVSVNCQTNGTYRPAGADGGIIPRPMVTSASGVGTELSDLLLVYYCVSARICEEINIQEGLRGRNDAPLTPNTFGASNVEYANLSSNTATALPATTPNWTAQTDSRVMARRLWCREGSYTSSGGYIYAVIYAR